MKKKLNTEIQKAVSNLTNNKKALRQMSIMTKMMMNLSSKEQIALYAFYRLIEKNARFHERLICYGEFKEAIENSKEKYKKKFKTNINYTNLEKEVNIITKRRRIYKSQN